MSQQFNFDLRTSHCIAIDSGPDTTNYLPNARKNLPNHTSHSNVSECAKNLLSCSKSLPNRENLLIVGHGNVGFFCLGSGNQIGKPNQIIASDNWQRNLNSRRPRLPYYWKPDMSSLFGEVNYLAVWACYVGAEKDGALLVFQLSKTLGVTVAAYTGLVYGNGKTLDGGEWQVSHYNDSDAPAPKPKIPGPEPALLVECMNININNEISPNGIPSEAIIRCELSLVGRERMVFQDKDAKEFLNTINFEEPIIQDNGIGAIITGELVLTFLIGNKEHIHRFRILADSVLQDEDSPSTYYFFNSLFNDVIGGVRGAEDLLQFAANNTDEE